MLAQAVEAGLKPAPTEPFRTTGCRLSSSWLPNPDRAAIMALMVKKPEKGKEGPSAVNKKAFRDYELLDKFEAGVSLVGSEVKSLRFAPADLTGSYARMDDGECWLIGAKIAPYQQAGNRGHDPTRKRKLLLHKAELKRIWGKLEQRGFTLIPLRVYFSSRGLAKVELALARGKRQYDKRQSITERTQKRDVDRSMKQYRGR
jgi:SsrA-binding protein